MTKIKNWLLALSAGALAIAAIYIKWLEGAAKKAKLKSLQEKEKELENEVVKHTNRADASITRAYELRKRLRAAEENMSGDG